MMVVSCPQLAVTEHREPTPAVVSSPDLLREMQVARSLQGLLEAVLWLVVAGSALGSGAAHAWADSASAVACVGAAGIALARALAVGGLRQRLGPHRVALHASGRWVVIEPHPADRVLGWSIDLAEPALPWGPLLRPGLAFLALALLQRVPIAGEPVSADPEATWRGVAFVLSLLLLHAAAGAAFTDRGARRRFVGMLAGLGAFLSLLVLARVASGMAGIHGLFEPLEGRRPDGLCVSRNHFGGYMLLVVPIALSLLGDAWAARARRVGDPPDARRSLPRLRSREGRALVWAALPSLLGIAALLASASRAGMLAFVAALALAVAGLRAERRVPAWAVALVIAGMTLTWLALEPPDVGLRRAADGVPGLLVASWAGFAVLGAARREPWLFAAFAGALLHAFVDRDLLVPAIAALFVVLAALARAGAPAETTPRAAIRGDGAA